MSSRVAGKSTSKVRRVAILGCGHLGNYLFQWTRREGSGFRTVLIFNRRSSPSFLELRQKHGKNVVFISCEDDADVNLLDVLVHVKPDLVVEVAHPDIVSAYGVAVLGMCDLLIGSPTALADVKLEKRLREASALTGKAVYVPCGALWGSQDIARMADNNTIESLCVTMKKHPDSLKLAPALANTRNDDDDEKDEVVIYEGPVRELCLMAPNNVNTMAAAAIAAHTLGFDKTKGRLVADKRLVDCHIVEVEVVGKNISGSESRPFSCHNRRTNPAPVGEVTGQATFASFAHSLQRATGKCSGFHLC